MSLSFLFAMAWKSAVISGAALLLVALLRKRAAADRAALLRVGVLLLLLLPSVSAILPALTIETAPDAVPLPALTTAELAAFAAAAPDAAPVSLWQQTELLAALVYASGLLLIGVRFTAGLLTLRRWTRVGRRVASTAWTRALARRVAQGKRAPLLIASDRVASPISWGLIQPVILLDPDTLARTGDADAVLAHEMAHVARRDWLSLVLARAAVALFWFNPLVWLLEREVVQHAEEAADSHALEQVDAVRYAETLVTCAGRCSRSGVPANRMAGSGQRLARRVRAVLDGRSRAPAGSRWTFAAMVGCIALAAPVAALELVERARPSPPKAQVAPLAPRVPAAPLAQAAVLSAPAALAVVAQAPSAVPVPVAPPAPPTMRREGFQTEIDEEAIERAAEAAEEAAERAEEQAERIAERASRDAERIAANAEQVAARAMRSARMAQTAGAEAMLQGAASMDAGARQMDQAAINLRSREYREREIARAAAQGRRVTHDELLRAIPEMQKGAREMRQGAKEMRAGAAEMRRQGI